MDDSGRVGQPHDGLFKTVFANADNAVSLLRSVVPPEVLAGLDLRSARWEPTSFVDPDLRQQQTDALFSVQASGRDAFVYLLLEHQSAPDAEMPFRMLRYVLRVWERYRRLRPGARRLPLVVPVVVYQGPRRWAGPVELSELIDFDLAALGPAVKFVPRFEFLLDDLSTQGAALLRARPFTPAALATVVVFILGRNPAVLKLLPEWVDVFQQLFFDPGGSGIFEALVTYLWNVSSAPESELFDFAESVGPEAREVAVTTAEALLARGERLGIAKGRELGAAKGLAEYLESRLVARFGPLPAEVRVRLSEASPALLGLWIDRVAAGADSVAEVIN